MIQSKSLAQRLFEDGATPLTGVESASSYRETLVNNKNLAYAIGAPTSDPWFEKELKATNSPSSGDFLVKVDSLAPGTAPMLTVGLWGMTDQPKITDHHVIVKVNDVQVGEITFDGIFYQEIQAALSGKILEGKAELLILTHPDFLAELDPLVKAREAEGLTVRLVNIEDVYAVYNHKIIDPHAIQEYIGHAWNSMQTHYVVLVGADTYDYLDYGGTGSLSFIPTIYGPTHPFVRHTPLDSLLGDVDGDQKPEVIVGRFPVRTSAEVDALVAKTLAYADKEYGKTAVFGADAYDGTLSFADVSQAWLENLPGSWSIKTAYLDEAGGVASARQTLLDAINSGQALVNYIGHSSDVQWSDQRLLTLQDAAVLTNTLRPAIFSQWSCFNTYLAWPSTDTLAHALLVYGEQGGSAMIGSASLTGQDLHEALGSRVINYLLTPGMRIGDALQKARQELAAQSVAIVGLFNAYQILGDPTLVIDP